MWGGKGLKQGEEGKKTGLEERKLSKKKKGRGEIPGESKTLEQNQSIQ